MSNISIGRVEYARKSIKTAQLEDIVAWAKFRKSAIESDNKFQQKPATLEMNAPLALIQLSFAVELRCLKVILKMAK